MEGLCPESPQHSPLCCTRGPAFASSLCCGLCSPTPCPLALAAHCWVAWALASLTLLTGPASQVPEHAYCAFQLAFAVVTAAVVSGSVAGRVTLPAWCCFCCLWHLLAYVPLARWVFYSGGWLAQLGVLDFAGGIVVETNSGVSGLVLAMLVGWQERQRRLRRRSRAEGEHPSQPLLASASASPPSHAPKPHSLPLILLGTGLLHVGWLGFNAGSAISAGYSAARALLNTHLGAAAGIGGFAAAEALWGGPGVKGLTSSPLLTWGRGSPTAIGAATGCVVGLVAITPAAGFISPMATLFLAAAAALCCYLAEHTLPAALGVTDTLNAFAGHGVAGIVGTLGVGVLARVSEGAPSDGLLAGGGGRLLGLQCLGLAVGVGVAAAGTAVAWGCVCAVFGGLQLPVLTEEEAGKEGEEGEEEDSSLNA